MVDESLFSYLKSYTPTEKRNSREDYLTQAFAWILQKFPTIKKDYVEFLISKLNEECVKCDLMQEIIIETQKRVSKGRIDLYIQIGNDIAFICEHKIYSELRDNQIKNYMNCEKEYQVEKLYSVLVTYNEYQHTQNTDVALIWKDVYNFFKSIYERRTNDHTLLYEERFAMFFIEQIMEYLREEGMAEDKMINNDTLKNWYFIKNVENSLGAIFKKLEGNSDCWEKECPILKEFDNPKGLKPEYHKKRWGRIGIDFYEQWNMGLFAGVILNPSDHEIYPENKEKGPDFVIIIDCEKEERSMYADSNFMKKLIKKFDNYTGEYIFIPSSDLKNEWRLAVIKRPLLDIISNAKDETEQEKALKDEIIKGINLMLDVK